MLHKKPAANVKTASLLYRAIDKNGDLVDVYLSDVRDQATAEAFFKQAQNTTGITPEQITTDKEPALYPAIANTFGQAIKHRDSKYKNNCIEADHRGIKSRYKVMNLDPAVERVFRAHVIDSSGYSKNTLFTNEVTTRFFDTPSKSSTCTLNTRSTAGSRLINQLRQKS